MNRIVVITNVLPEYRRGFLTSLSELYPGGVVFYCQDRLQNIPHATLASEEFPNSIRIVKFFSIGKNYVTWQFLPFFELIRNFDAFVLTGNPRILSSVVLSFFARLLGKKIIVWGHVTTAGSLGFSRKVRIWWWSLFHGALTYTEAEASELRERGFKGKITSINNGVDYHAIRKTYQDLGLIVDIDKKAQSTFLISCCRLMPKNRIDLLLQAITIVKETVPSIHLSIVGDGPLREEYERLVCELGIERSVTFHGAVYNEEGLASLFHQAKFMVHPGAIGLSALHSLCYSVPIITHNKQDAHMPEFSVLRDNYNCTLYSRDEQLADKICSALSMPFDIYRSLVENASVQVENNYNTREMARNFISAVT